MTPRPRAALLFVVGIAVMLIISGCSVLESGAPIQITTISGLAEPLVIIDNCPAVRSVSLSEDNTLVWSVERAGPSPNSALIELRLGGEPNGWTLRQALERSLDDGAGYQLTTQPSGHQLKFSLDDLVAGEGFSEQGIQALERADVANPCDTGATFDDIWQQGVVLLMVGLLVLAVVATAVVKLLQVALSGRDLD